MYERERVDKRHLASTSTSVCISSYLFGCVPCPYPVSVSSFLGTEDLKKEDLGLLKKYYEESFGFPYLMDLSGTIRSATDLGDLW